MLTETQYNEAVEKYANMIFRIALGYTKSVDDASDIAQDVLLQLFVSKKEFESQEHIRSWLIRVAINQCKKYFRAPWHRQVPVDDYINTLFYEQPDYIDLYRAVMALDKKYRVPLLLFYCDGYSTREIAGFLKLPENTVSTRVRRGKEKLREYLKEEG